MKKKYFYTFILLLLAFFTMPEKGAAQGANHKAYSIFLYNFARYTDWPAVEGTTFRFAVLGKNSIFDELVKALPGKTVNGKKCTVEVVENLSQLKEYQVVYVPALKSSQLKEVLDILGNSPTLVITELDGLIKKGADISFVVTEDQKLRFEFNEETLKNRHLRLASELRALALNSK